MVCTYTKVSAAIPRSNVISSEARIDQRKVEYIEARDILGAVTYLRDSRGYAGPVAVFGHSYGAVAALYPLLILLTSPR